MQTLRHEKQHNNNNKEIKKPVDEIKMFAFFVPLDQLIPSGCAKTTDRVQSSIEYMNTWELLTEFDEQWLPWLGIFSVLICKGILS